MKKFSDFDKINESSPDAEFQSKVEKTHAYKNLSKKIQAAITVFKLELEEEIGYEEGENDNDLSVNNAIQSALDANYGW